MTSEENIKTFYPEKGAPIKYDANKYEIEQTEDPERIRILPKIKPEHPEITIIVKGGFE